MKHSSQGTVHIKIRSMSEFEEDFHDQDSDIKELEKEIENELVEAGVISKRNCNILKLLYC